MMTPYLLTCLCVLQVPLVLCAVTGGATFTPPVVTTLGPVRGEVVTLSGHTLHRYRGIPYVAPPVGGARFSPPSPHSGWVEVRDVVEYGDRCVQTDSYDSHVFTNTPPPPISEDCLTLNVFVPVGGSTEANTR